MFPKLKLTPKLIRLAYRFVDVEAFGETAVADGRMIEYSFIIQKLDSMPRGRVLDVGCTARLNYLPAALASIGWEVWGIDLREFKFKHPNFHFVSEDIKNTSFSDSFFDAVYAVSTLEHIGLSGRYGVSQEDLQGDAKAIGEIARILRPGGTLLCTLPYGREAKIIKPVQRIYNKSSLEKLFCNWAKKGEVYYCQDDDGWWLAIPEEDAVKAENSSGESVLALLELAPVK